MNLTPIRGLHAQIPRYPPHIHHNDCFDSRHALADPSATPAPDGSDKVVHLIAFAALAFPLARTGRIGLLPIFVGASAYGGIIEVYSLPLDAARICRIGLRILQG